MNRRYMGKTVQFGNKKKRQYKKQFDGTNPARLEKLADWERSLPAHFGLQDTTEGRLCGLLFAADEIRTELRDALKHHNWFFNIGNAAEAKQLFPSLKLLVGIGVYQWTWAIRAVAALLRRLYPTQYSILRQRGVSEASARRQRGVLTPH